MKWEICVLDSWTCQLLILVLHKTFLKHFNNAVAFMSDTVSVMKGARSGVQKRIKTDMPDLMMWDV